MSNFPSGVTVVTAIGEGGEPRGLTASAFSSVSLDPPLVLVCVERGASTLPAIRSSGGFSVNFLAEGEAAVSTRFAAKGEEKFEGVRWSRPLSKEAGPLLEDGVGARIECRVQRLVDAGDHVVVLGEVVGGDLSGDTRPLVHWSRRYWDLREA